MALSYSIDHDESAHLGRQGRKHFVTITTDTYATGGFALDKASCGCPTKIYSLKVIDGAAGYLTDYDISEEKLLVYEQDAGNALAEVGAGALVLTLICEVLGY